MPFWSMKDEESDFDDDILDDILNDEPAVKKKSPVKSAEPNPPDPVPAAQGWKSMSYSHCQELCQHLQAGSWLAAQERITNQMPVQQVDQTLDNNDYNS